MKLLHFEATSTKIYEIFNFDGESSLISQGNRMIHDEVMTVQ